MRLSLTLHPDSRCDAVTQIDVEAARPRPLCVELRYAVTGRIAGLCLPEPAVSARSDGLWRRTCFEAFLRCSAGEAYYEFNFSPSTNWAAYRFSDYRSGMVAAGIAAPRIEVQGDGGCFELRATLDLDTLPDLPHDAAWRLGLSAVIEETDGNISYWALTHPAGKPDFHHSDCFALTLAPA